jgi:hypothetical protein
MGDQKVSLGFVGDVFGVMANVNTVDRLIRANQPGRKPGASQPIPLKQNLVPRFDNKSRATLSNKIRVTRWKYVLTYISR